THTKARIIKINTKRIEREIACGKIVVVTGFQGITEEKDITTLGRGGSDTTAVALAAVLEADICEIYTDVDGVYTTDPGVFRGARKLDSICYDEMLEMASTGAKVLQSRSVEFAKKYGVVLHVRSSFSKKEGTLVLEEVDRVEKMLVSGITSDINQAKITILKVPDRPGVAAQIFGALAEVAINVDMIIQSSSEGKFNDISFTVAKDDLKKALKNLEKPAKELNAAEVTADDGVGKISIIGVGMRTNPGVAAKMFSALAEGKINIEMISTSEIKISCIIRREHIEKATRLLHRTFELGKRRTKR
ncbi:TPA: aspartate kinase, partial [bacterium]|nr:aspartate kinase [bacterium]